MKVLDALNVVLVQSLGPGTDALFARTLITVKFANFRIITRVIML